MWLKVHACVVSVETETGLVDSKGRRAEFGA